MKLGINKGSGESSPVAGSNSAAKVCYTKSLTPTLDQLEKLNLRSGVNDISFTVESKFQGKQTIMGKIFLWDYNKRIIISDVDGTITKSDMLGHVRSCSLSYPRTTMSSCILLQDRLAKQTPLESISRAFCKTRILRCRTALSL
jgi:hypothetical protein